MRETLLDYVTEELSDAEASAVDDHLFECDACATTATQLAQVGAAVRAAVANGKAGVVATDALLAELEANGVQLRRYELAPGSLTECTVGAEDVFVVASYSADFAGVERITVVAEREGGGVLRRLEGIPVPPGARTVHVLLRADVMRGLPSSTHTVTISSGDRVVARYTLSHTAFVR
jgi:anti-sigma factor RsiW